MAEKRVISTSIWRDEWFGPLDPFCKCVWIGLFSACSDDQGRMIDNPVLIRADIFPYEDTPVEQIDRTLSQFQADGKIRRYQVDGKAYIQILNWWDHQAMQWAMPSKHPAPDGWLDRVRATIKGQYITNNWPSREEKPADPPASGDHVDPPGGPPTPQRQADQQDPNLYLYHDHNHGDSGASAPASPTPPVTEPEPAQSKRLPRSIAVKAYHDIANCWPNKAQIGEIDRTVTDTERWRVVVNAWMLKGYSPKNVEGMLEWYVKGVPQQAKNGNGKRASPATGSALDGLADFAARHGVSTPEVVDATAKRVY